MASEKRVDDIASMKVDFGDIARAPDNARHYHQMGLTQRNKKDRHSAIWLLAKAVLLAPKSHIFLSDLLYSQFFAGHPQAHDILFQLARHSTFARPSINSAMLFVERREHDAAVHQMNRAIALEPGSTVAYSKAAIPFLTQYQFGRAIWFLQKAIQLDERWIESHLNYAYLLEQTDRFAEAKSKYEWVIKHYPAMPEPYFNGSLCCLALGELEQGWKWYEYRWSVNTILSFGSDFRLQELRTNVPVFTGSNVRRLFVWGEQGIGDQIMFSSILKDAAQAAENMIISVDPRLHALMGRSFPQFNVISSTSILNESEYDAQIPMGSLGLHYRNSLESFPKTGSYLTVDALKAQRYRSHFLRQRKIVVGLSWRSANLDSGQNRSIPIEVLLGHLHDEQILWVNLQYDFNDDDKKVIRGILPDDNQFDCMDDLDKRDDLDAVASTIAACDFVISVGNSVAHLAGAIGKPVLVLVPSVGSWRWMCGRSAGSPWYPSAKIFRRSADDNWTSTLEKVKQEVRILMRHNNSQ